MVQEGEGKGVNDGRGGEVCHHHHAGVEDVAKNREGGKDNGILVFFLLKGKELLLKQVNQFSQAFNIRCQFDLWKTFKIRYPFGL